MPGLVLPDIAKVKARRGSDDDCHLGPFPVSILALAVDLELTMIVGNAMVWSG